jgi:hypothetical protein
MIEGRSDGKTPQEGEFVYALPWSNYLARGFVALLVCGQCDELLDRWKSRVEHHLGQEHIRLERFGPHGLLLPGREEIEINSGGDLGRHRILRPAIYEVICKKCQPPAARLHFRALASDLIELYVEAAGATNLEKSEMQIVLSSDGSRSLRRGRAQRPQLWDEHRYPWRRTPTPSTRP